MKTLTLCNFLIKRQTEQERSVKNVIKYKRMPQYREFITETAKHERNGILNRYENQRITTG